MMQGDIERIREFNSVYEQHHEELKATWSRLRSEMAASKCNDPSLTFFQELKKNWQHEFREIDNIIESPRIREQLKESILWSFLAGCMVSNNWITQRLASDINLIFGDRLVIDIKAVRGRTKCRGTALGVAFAAVSVQGQLFTKGEQLNLEEAESKLKNRIAPQTPSDIALTTIPPWERESDATDEIERALESIEKRAHMPGIDGKELTLLLVYQTQLTVLLTAEQTMGELIVELKLSLLKGESLGEVSEEGIPKEREKLEKQKARFRKNVEEDKEKVRNILKDAGLT